MHMVEAKMREGLKLKQLGACIDQKTLQSLIKPLTTPFQFSDLYTQIFKQMTKK
jgi:hypothetical protein